MKKGISRITKRLFSVVLVVAFALLLMPLQDMTVQAEDAVPSGYTPIYTVQDLYGISNASDKNYILMNDIDLAETRPGGSLDSGNGWTPIEWFSGIFDGNGHHIMNMYIQKNIEESSYIGFFSYLDGSATVKNLGLININISVSGFATSGYISIGGISGYCEQGTIENCFVTGTINGKIDLNENTYASTCIGGILGVADTDDTVVVDCYTDVSINANSQSIGGIAGFAGVQNCYVRGTIDKALSSDEIFQIVDSRVAPNCYYPSERGKDKYATPLTDTQMRMSAAFKGFDFKDTWIIDPYSTYPYPQLRSCLQVRANSIKLVSAPRKLDYLTTDEGLDLSGGKIEIAYENGKTVTADMTNDMVNFEGFKEGEQEVKVSYLGHECSFKINVEKGKASIEGLEDISLVPGNTEHLKAETDSEGEITYESSNPEVAEVNDNGKITALAAGKTKITVTVAETDVFKETSTSIQVTVNKMAQKITLKSSYDKKMGQTFSLNVKRLGTGKITYKSSNPKVAKVDSYGKVTTLKPGNATITVKVKDTDQYKGGTKKTKVKVRFHLGKPQITKVYQRNNYASYQAYWKKVTGASGYEIEWRYSAWVDDSVGYRVEDKVFSTTGLNYYYTPNPAITDEFDVRVRAYIIVNGQRMYGSWCGWEGYSLF